MRSGWPRARAAALLVAVGAAVLAVGGAGHGWVSAAYLAPIVLVPAAGLYLLAGRDSDAGAVTRREVDERLAWQRLRVQALVGRVLSMTVAVAYIVAVTTKATLWPFAVLMGAVVVAFGAGWWFYGDHGPGPRSASTSGRASRQGGS